MVHILFLIFCLVASNISHRVEGMRPAEENLELERQLKHINKPPIVTINTTLGYIVDCVDIKKQPAFDHPLLKNHKLQLKPSFQNIMGKADEKNSSAKLIGFGLEKNQCPVGTVPIRRTTKEDLIRGKSLFNYPILTTGQPGTHIAEVTYGPFGFKRFYGASGSGSLWNPKVNHDQTSNSHMWVQNGQGDGTNKITVGWHVSPKLYGDYETHIYTTWTSDNFKRTGCYNLQCPGFVQIDRQLHVGIATKTSTYGGDTEELDFSLSQDPSTQNWWVTIEHKNIGYFPAALFTNMKWVDRVGWGGTTTTPAGTPSPPMGSGHFPDRIYEHTCYFRYMSYKDESRKDYGPEENVAKSFSDKPNCFGVDYYGNKGSQVGFSVQFGGPGGLCGN
ncbi:uncharacterized protein LOC130731620 [Lotus japonicus]|uniref:uncharacterized protein LOC130731620 n=2 Tax=Lotus japonicus TaxID=34305 RepID=UPI00258CFE62|nr:uncharacterized protein LOC130731620 [Lotus japonicus]